MKLFQACAFLATLLLARAGWAQDEDPEQLKKKILAEVEKRLKAEEERILKEVSKIIDEELAKSRKGEKPSNVEPKKARGFLGVSPADLTDEEKDDLGIEHGVRVVSVVEGSPAAEALKVDDILLTLDGRPVEDTQTVRDVVGSKGAGQKIAVEVLRGKERKKLTITLARHPEDAEPKKVEPKKEPKKEEPQTDEPSKDDLRSRIKKFLDRGGEDTPKKEEKKEPKKEPKTETPSDDDAFALDEAMMEQIRPLLEQFGMNPEDYFEKGEDGKWRPNAELREMFKQFDFRRFFGDGEEPMPEPKKEEKKVEPKKEEKKTEAKKEEKKTEAAKPAWIGVVPADLSDEDRAELDLEQGVGLQIAEVIEGSPAAKAGLEKGDIVVKINGKALRGEEGLQKFMAGAKAGQSCELTVLRKGKEKKISVTLAERK
jgi:S1-C subfamily serine protease